MMFGCGLGRWIVGKTGGPVKEVTVGKYTRRKLMGYLFLGNDHLVVGVRLLRKYCTKI